MIEIVKADPGYFTLIQDEETGEFQRDVQIIAWAIQYSELNNHYVMRPLTVDGCRHDGTAVMYPDGQIEHEGVTHPHLAVLNQRVREYRNASNR